MADSNENVIRKTLGASTPSASGYLEIEVGQKAYCPLEKCEIRRTGETSYIKLPNQESVAEQVATRAELSQLIRNGVEDKAPSENAIYDKFEAYFTLGPYRFAREGWTTSTFGGGDADLPASDWAEDRATANHVGRGVYATVSCRITSVYFSFDPSYMSGDVTIYAKINGVKTTLWTILATEKRKGFFPVGMNVSAGQEILFGFTYPNNGQRFGYPMALATIRPLVV